MAESDGKEYFDNTGQWADLFGAGASAVHLSDFNGDGAEDAFAFRSATGVWEVQASSGFDFDADQWTEYAWEGNSWDYSMSDGVSIQLPSRMLFEAGRLRWSEGSREWMTGDGKVVAKHRRAPERRHSALLVDEDWLRATLKQLGYELVLGWLGEKRLIAAEWGRGNLGEWTLMNGIAYATTKGWRFTAPRLEVLGPME